MIMFICIVLPPLLCMYLRHYLKGTLSELKVSFQTMIEFLLTLLLFTLASFAILVLVFQHTGAVGAAFQEYSDFVLHYLCMAVFLAVFLPTAEHLITTRLSLENHFSLGKIRVKSSVWVSLYAAVLVLMNFIRCFDNALWGDEAFTASISKASLLEMVERTASDVHPPLYYVLTHAAYLLVGDSGFAYHLVSFLAYFILIILALTYVRKKLGTVTAVVLLTFSSLTEYAVKYNVEIRMYSWACLFVLLSYLCVYEILRKNSWKSWLLFTVFSLCAAYTHYYALIMVAVFYAGFLLLAVRKKQYRGKIAVACLLTVAGYLPWLMVLLKAFTRTSSGWWLTSIPQVTDCILCLFGQLWVFAALAAGFLLFVLYETNCVELSGVSLQELRTGQKLKLCIRNPEQPGNEVLFVSLGLFSAIMTAAVGLGLSYVIRPFFLTRYLWPASAVVYVALGRSLSGLKLRRLWCALIVLLFLGQAVPSYFSTWKAEVALNTATAQFTANVELNSSDLVLTNSSHHAWTIDTYYYPDTQTINFTEENFEDLPDGKNFWLFWTKELDESLIEGFRERGEVCELVYQGKLGADTVLNVYQVITDGE